MTTPGVVPHLGAVVIGRDEAKTLAQALDSVSAVAAGCVYVDSASDDDSAAIAESRGARVLRLADDGGLSPARARNEGFRLLQQEYPQCHQVFFLDGDCIASAQWLRQASLELDRLPTMGLLCGRLQEREPERTVYNRLFELGWQDAPEGPVLASGGIFLARTQAFSESGGFESGLRAREEIHMCWRMSRHGWQIVRLPGVMATHDADMGSLREWLARSRRDGYGALQVLGADPRGVGRFELRSSASAWTWTVGWAACLALAVGMAARSTRPRRTASVALPVVLSLPGANAVHIALRVGRRTQLSGRDAAVYGLLMMASKWSYVQGQVLCLLDSTAPLPGRRARCRRQPHT